MSNENQVSLITEGPWFDGVDCPDAAGVSKPSLVPAPLRSTTELREETPQIYKSLCDYPGFTGVDYFPDGCKTQGGNTGGRAEDNSKTLISKT